MKTIYNTYVKMESQEQCDRMKQLCIDNGLPYWKNNNGFEVLASDKKPIFCYIVLSKEFFVYDFFDFGNKCLEKTYEEVTEQEFIELLNTK